MSSATLRCRSYFDSALPATLLREDVSSKVTESGVYRMASRKGYDAKNVLATLRVNVEFVRSMLGSNGSSLLADALADIDAAAERLDHIVAEMAQ